MIRDLCILLKSIRSSMLALFCASLVGVSVAALEQAAPVRLQHLVNELIRTRDLAVITAPGLVIVGLLLAAQVLRYVQRASAESAVAKLKVRLFERAFKAILARPLRWFQSQQPVVLQGTVDRTARGVAELIRLVSGDLFISTVGVIMAVCLILRTDITVGIAVAVVVPLLTLVTFLQAKSQSGVRVDIEGWRQTLSKRLGEAFNGLEDIKLFGAEDMERRLLSEELVAASKKELSHHRAMAAYDLVKGLVDVGGFLVVISLALKACIQPNSTLGVGGVLMLVGLYAKAVEPIRHLHRIIDESVERAQYLRMYIDFVKEEPAQRQPVLSCTTPDIAFSEVSYSHSNSTAPVSVFSDFSAHIPGGSVVAVQGPNGSGKSTLIRLLAGLIEPASGRVVIGRHDVEPVELRASPVAVMSQQPHIFAGTIRQNLLFARGDAPDSELQDACIRAWLDVATLPNKMDYDVGDRGLRLSGGQRQRLALARMYLVDKPVVVLDEPTNNLDPQSAQHLLTNLRSIFPGKTVLVITHIGGDLPWADYVLEFSGLGGAITLTKIECDKQTVESFESREHVLVPKH